MSVAAPITTALSEREQAKLVRVATRKTVLEVGSWFGASTVLMAQVARLVVAVDWHRGDPHTGHGDTSHEFLAALDQYMVRDAVIPMIGRSEDVLRLLRPNSFDVAFVDAYHDYKAVRQDISLVWPLVREDGLVVFHDYGLPQFGVTAAVDECPGKLLSVTDTLALVRR